MASTRIKIWDSFIRIYHWLMVVLIPALWWTAEEGYMERHQQLAVLLGSLLITRIGWGIWGSESARFSQFVRHPQHAFQHFRELRHGQYQPGRTHNPAGGWFVLVLLLLVLMQFSSGLFASDDIFFDGPLHALVAADTGDLITDLHKLNFNFILAAVGLHVLAILVYRWRGVKLLEAMLHGYVESHKPAPELRHGIIALIVAVVLTGALWWLL
ncbi:Cytochrome b [Pseudidiomarina planktonica]|uniref:Cytochrome b n=1 Tax=Pseudidiomarina planktonica TaxID=1323738 RepID=A0A1Y6EZI3_9GAMM|nr:cytochrome b/b6 domain-containing protein [Pseudidiomarina planktonica]SMQ67666.1 Cytochrome b [Pseudidiomarina planktonica]